MMNTMPTLHTALLDLLFEIRNENLSLIIGGGYGIYLKQQHIRKLGMRTLLTEWPEARSTNDLDLFLRPELLIDSAKLKPLSKTLRRLGYQVIPGAEKYQFARPGPDGGPEGSLKIDLLTGPQSRFQNTTVQVNNRRVRPNPSIDLHAHPVDEAFTLEDDLLPITIDGTTSNGSPFEAEVYLPHPLTFTMMKLFAFRDRIDDMNKEFGSYHALDIYTILALTSEEEWLRACQLRELHQNNGYILEAAQITKQYFSTLSSKGMLRMRESPYCRPELQLNDFCNVLCELFPEHLMVEAR
ncbi:hypothetical protein [Synechococcus sp. PCC 6312]|uniref:hypothetical protein n=1 Tax=Synechococcus sp. (strain ATCC 27167 / PCC 6312) TaxID=195253 RepID=UPI00029F2DA8|nr:hypothetical protein [Synechococcus sp. PCC 6312]AFY60115.1 hypothetical protein Syn6312_0908 [Synechococcus sp. PCC 6312]